LVPGSDRASAFFTYDPQRKRITLSVHVQPGAASSAIIGPHGNALKIRVAAPAVENKANTALVTFLSKALGVRSAHILIRHGGKGRRKVIDITDVPDDALAHIRSVIEEILR
jgi:uncharacterized protein (TIGR00251 family)